AQTDAVPAHPRLRIPRHQRTGTALTLTPKAQYHLLFGAALLLTVVGQTVVAGTPSGVTSTVAVVLVVVALIRYRPRRKVEDSKEP
ncbi:hypothetical protein CLV70_124109, partial [Pseudosporangium ferrugineum]